MTQKIKLGSEALDKLNQYENSISHWSTEHASMLLRAKKMLEAVDSLYVARQKLIDDALAAEGLKASDIVNVHIDPSGELTVTLRDPVASN